MKPKLLLQPLYALAALAVLGVALALASNRVNLLDPPGPGVRVWDYLTANIAQTDPYAAYPELRTRRYWRDGGDILDAALSAGAALGWQITRVDRHSLGFEAVADTPVLRMRDDVIVRIRPAGGGSSQVDVRSASRHGIGDFGANVHRIEHFYRLLEARL